MPAAWCALCSEQTVPGSACWVEWTAQLAWQHAWSTMAHVHTLCRCTVDAGRARAAYSAYVVPRPLTHTPCL